MTEKVEYEFKAVNPEEYELALLLKANHKSLVSLFEKAVGKLEGKIPHHERLKDADPSSIDGFDVTPSFYPYLRTVLHRQTRKVNQAVGQDGINVLTQEVRKARFVRSDDGKEWNIIILFGGMYAQKH